FFEIHHDNPQEGPGDFASTRRAFSLLKNLPSLPKILDAGCGPGRQTFDLCRLTQGNIIAVDFHKPYVDALQRKSKTLGLNQQITALQGDMANLQFKPQTFDVIWSEGAIYNLGFKAGLKLWKPLLKKAGYVAVTEIAWLASDIPDNLKAFWDSAYPQIQDIEGNLADIRAAGYQPVAHFILPESAWWDYYRAIEKRVMLMKEKYKNNSNALEVLETEMREIDLYRKYSDYYGYVFFVAQAL
ncbi:MAG: class I SAM-dependent methyltransferase, partial [Desulfobacterales bacterium]